MKKTTLYRKRLIESSKEAISQIDLDRLNLNDSATLIDTEHQLKEMAKRYTKDEPLKLTGLASCIDSIKKSISYIKDSIEKISIEDSKKLVDLNHNLRVIRNKHSKISCEDPLFPFVLNKLLKGERF